MIDASRHPPAEWTPAFWPVAPTQQKGNAMTWESDSLFSVRDKVVAVTGAAGVIYSSIARGLAARGARVALLDLLADKAGEVAKQVNADGGEAIALPCNVLDPVSIQAALDGILKALGRVDVLINGAGGNRPGATVRAMASSPTSLWRRSRRSSRSTTRGRCCRPRSSASSSPSRAAAALSTPPR